VIGEPAAFSRSALDDDLAALLCEHLAAGWRKRNPVFLLLDFLWQSYNHPSASRHHSTSFPFTISPA
jgi:hypothetical protein